MSADETYEIRVKGKLEAHWSDWFEGLEVHSLAEGETSISGPIPDQAALHGVIAKIRDLGLPLISIMRVEPGEPAPTRQTVRTDCSAAERQT